MKLTEINKELLELAKSLGISVRKEKGNFRSGYCLVNDKEVIVLNKNASLETLSSVLAICLAPYSDKIYIKPVLREYIESEIQNKSKEESDKIQISLKDNS
ncbi:MAG: hypothetical protein N2319_02950 [Candidatus Kapabacteria bacterium]|nr:hypothetical protein [Candidatus Kapabacteria bacterium]